MAARRRRRCVVYLLHFSVPYRHARHYTGSTRNLKRRLAEHRAGRGHPLTAAAAAAGAELELARLWRGAEAREYQLKRQGGAARRCPMCGVRPRRLPINADGSLSRSLTTDAQKLAAGVMTAAQQAEHTALRRGAWSGRAPGVARSSGPPADDQWSFPLAGSLLTGSDQKVSHVIGGTGRGSFGPMSGKSNPGSNEWRKDFGKSKPRPQRAADTRRPPGRVTTRGT